MRRGPLALFLCLSLSAPAPSDARPDPTGAVAALLDGPFDVAGDLIGGAGLVVASGLGMAGDVLALIDRNRVTRHLLFGVLSRPTHALALGVSNGSSALLEGLRREDIERLPEPASAYLDSAPTAGRLDTLLSGLGSLGLAPGDLLAAPAIFGLRAVGAREPASGIARRRQEARTRALGPLPAEVAPDEVAPDSATLRE